MTRSDPVRLGELRAQIDAIDESVHRLLMQRATVIDELIRVKGAARGGAAFRPGREADMMRRLVARHSGPLPLTSVEHLWREIISTFTHLQAPFEVAVSLGAGERDAVETARFAFGFQVPLVALRDAGALARFVAEGGDRLGVVLLREAGEPWWEKLGQAAVVARLPFIDAAGRPAGEPALVVAPPLADPVPHEVVCYATTGGGALPAGAETLAAFGAHRLIALPAGAPDPSHASGDLDIRPVGGYAAPLAADAVV